MAFDTSESNDEIISGINITPLVDVLLVLLVILIISAPYISQEGVELSLPQTSAVEELPPDLLSATVSIDKNGAIFLDSKKMNLVKLRSELNLLAKKKNFTLFFEADKSVAYEFIVRVLSEIQASGISEVGLVALPS